MAERFTCPEEVADLIVLLANERAGRIENDAGRQTMNHKDFRISGLAASPRRASFHRGIVRAAHEVDPERMSCEGLDLARIPYFKQDTEDHGNPEPVKVLGEKKRERGYAAFSLRWPSRPCSSTKQRKPHQRQAQEGRAL